MPPLSKTTFLSFMYHIISPTAFCHVNVHSISSKYWEDWNLREMKKDNRELLYNTGIYATCHLLTIFIVKTLFNWSSFKDENKSILNVTYLVKQIEINIIWIVFKKQRERNSKLKSFFQHKLISRYRVVPIHIAL